MFSEIIDIDVVKGMRFQQLIVFSMSLMYIFSSVHSLKGLHEMNAIVFY